MMPEGDETVLRLGRVGVYCFAQEIIIKLERCKSLMSLEVKLSGLLRFICSHSHNESKSVSQIKGKIGFGQLLPAM